MANSDNTWQPACRPLRYDEISKTLDVRERAFRDDPVMDYLYNTPDAKDPCKINFGTRVTNAAEISYYVSKKNILAVDGGDGFITYRTPLNAMSPPRRALERIVLAVLFFIFRVFIRLLSSREQWRRLKELDEKDAAATKASLGDQINDMFVIDMLAVAPEKQGMGYGSALVEAIVVKADAQSRSTWLFTRPATTGFYKRFGFEVVTEYSFGEKNPTWTKPPVPRVIMVREPKLLRDMRSEKALQV